MIRCLVVIALICLLFGTASGSETGQTRIIAPELELDWPDSGNEVQSWQVRSLQAEHHNDSGWQSLVSRTATGVPISQHLVVHFPGTEWMPIVTEPDSGAPAPGAIHRRWLSADGAWMLDQRLIHTGATYRLLLSLELTRRESGLAPQGAQSLRLSVGPGIGEEPIEGLGIATSLYSFAQPLISQDGTARRVSLSETGQTEHFEADGDDQWAGLNSRYFALLVRPLRGAIDGFEFGQAESPHTETLPDRYLPWAALDLTVPELAAGEATRWEFELFSGPKSRTALSGEEADSSYIEVLFHGLWRWMRALSFALLVVLAWLYALIPNWGLAICLLAVIVRVLLFPLARWALSSQQEFSAVQSEIKPELARIKQTYKGGEQSERILQLYEKHNVSPLAGLKPLLIVLIQIPVFVALFHVLGQAYELREASFLWMSSLAEPDRLFGFGVDLPFFGAYFNLLPVIMALSTLVTIKLSPAPVSTPAEQRRHNLFLGLMTVFFFLLFYPFPSGMVLYWTIANILHIGQAWFSRNRHQAT